MSVGSHGVSCGGMLSGENALEFFAEPLRLFEGHRRVGGEGEDTPFYLFRFGVLAVAVASIVRIHERGAYDAAGPAVIEMDVFSLEEGAEVMSGYGGIFSPPPTPLPVRADIHPGGPLWQERGVNGHREFLQW